MPINAGSPGIKSIQRGTFTIASNNLSGTATITAVNTSKAQLTYNGASNSANPEVRLELTNGTTLTATRGNGDPSAATVSYEVTEWQ